MASIVSSLCSGTELHGRAEDIDKFSFSLSDCRVSVVRRRGRNWSSGILEGSSTSSPHWAPITIVAMVSCSARRELVSSQKTMKLRTYLIRAVEPGDTRGRVGVKAQDARKREPRQGESGFRFHGGAAFLSFAPMTVGAAALIGYRVG